MALCPYTTADVFGNPTAASLRALAKDLGTPVYLAGGTARDVLLGRPPKEMDLSAQTTPEVLHKMLGDRLTKTTPFGVVTFPLNGHTVELAAQREDGPYVDGRRPDTVRFAGMAEDAARRDFTVNALYVDVTSHEVTDLCGGLADMQHRLLRMVGPVDRLVEDHVRPLRLVRFAARLDFEVDTALWDTALAFGKTDTLTRLSPERQFMELTAMLTGGGAHRAVALLDDLGYLEHLLPELKEQQGVEQSDDYHPEGDVWTHNLLLLKAMGPADPVLAWAVLLHDVAKPRTQGRRGNKITFHGHCELGATMATDILRRLHAPKRFTADVAALVKQHLRFKDIPKMRQNTLHRFLTDPLVDDHLQLHLCDCTASHGKLEILQLLRHRLLQQPPDTAPSGPPVSGADILALGVPKGPEVGRWLNKARELFETHGPMDKATLLEKLQAAIKP